jgi:hypothetical protein
VRARHILAATIGLAATPAAGAMASTVSVQGGTLTVASAPADRVLMHIRNGPVVDGPPSGGIDGFPEFSLLRRGGLWQGVRPAPGPGCAAPPAGATALLCQPLTRIDLALGPNDDFVSLRTEDVPAVIDGGAGDDGITYAAAASPTLIGGPGDDGILINANGGEVRAGPGDDVIVLDYQDHRVTVDCGPGNDTIRAWFWKSAAAPDLDKASCPPILEWLGAVPLPPPGVGAGQPGYRVGRDGRVRVPVFKLTEPAHGTLRLREARRLSHGLPVAGTKWRDCGAGTRRFDTRAGRVVKVGFTIRPSVLRRMGTSFGRGPVVHCSFHVAAVDAQGERFHEEDLTVALVRAR